MPQENGTNGAKWLGISIDKWINLFTTVGFPTLFSMMVLAAVWCYVPPVVDGHLQFLKQNATSLETMTRTLEAMNMTMTDIHATQKELRVFMQTVREDHRQCGEKLSQLIEATRPPR